MGETASDTALETAHAPPPSWLGPPLAALGLSIHFTVLRRRSARASGLKLWRQDSGWSCARRRSGSAAAWVRTGTWVRVRTTPGAQGVPPEACLVCSVGLSADAASPRTVPAGWGRGGGLGGVGGESLAPGLCDRFFHC